MTVSHATASGVSGAPSMTPETIEPELAESGNPWRDAAVLLGRRAGKHFRTIVAAGLICGALAGMAKLILPTTYKASAQILIDPQEFRSFDADQAPSALDANAAINYVESQMGVIGSERVLLRVIHQLGLAGAPPLQPDAETPPESPEARRARELAETKTLLVLQREIAITRAERSFLVTITAAAKSPERASELANAVVKAYGDVNAIDRMASARRLAADLNMRVEDLRRQLGDSESKLLNFRVAHNLVGMNDKAISQRRIAETTDALTAAENREAQARARLKQLEASPRDVGAVASFGPDPESRQLQLLIESRAAARNELEQLQGTLGDLYPSVVAGKARLRELDRRIAQSLAGLRRSTKAQLGEAQSQVAALSKQLDGLSAETTRAREFEPRIQEMESDIEAKRKSLAMFQTRWREADDMSRREAPNFRIISPARAPSAKNKAVSMALWTVAGGVVGAALAFGALAFATIFEAPGAAPAADDEDGEQARDVFDEEGGKEDAAREALAPSSQPLECLGDLPVIAPAAGPPGDGAAFLSEARKRPHSPFSETARAIYRRLREENDRRRDPEDERPLVVLVAATWPQAGASTLAANLARVAAAEGDRALVIDAHSAHPAQDQAVSPNAPKTLIKLAGRIRPLVRLAPFSQSLSLIPAWADEERICAEIAEDSLYRPVAGINDHFDFVVLDGPDASDEEGLRALVPAADQILLVVSREPGDEADAPRLLARLGSRPGSFAAYVRAAPGISAESAAA
ncbi:exopolysaccharide transport family protein [Rhodoblastus acidophilus]|uniref:Exopolysaccharide transport family protein n=1 Tax=Candidatus Rhodoblastus alkanivorans TaxID=2954117 RepID=A0ABS9Z4E9_9HYPH|nr:exopolysaccharide transport family protein [Candidatus Rhodoblastus alkanivorans]MCI4680453.1 exopolysaccharide transport family protein [Candidatus Rhodoblastus alkanivorans]MCI4681946.1 exopolysaccharide transport family protein [Candidatus Rhodoblastus alkanivorans]MDI4642996.1 exopolysaccharide transport family protein [Rhodoblastus acidophilus]